MDIIEDIKFIIKKNKMTKKENLKSPKKENKDEIIKKVKK